MPCHVESLTLKLGRHPRVVDVEPGHATLARLCGSGPCKMKRNFPPAHSRNGTIYCTPTNGVACCWQLPYGRLPAPSRVSRTAGQTVPKAAYPSRRANPHDRSPAQKERQGWIKKTGDKPDTHWQKEDRSGASEPQEDRSKDDRPPLPVFKFHPTIADFLFKEQMVRAHSLKLFPNSTAQTEIGPNSMSPFTTLVNLDQPRPP